MELISNNDIIKKAYMPSLTAKQGVKVKYMNQDYIVMPLFDFCRINSRSAKSKQVLFMLSLNRLFHPAFEV